MFFNEDKKCWRHIGKDQHVTTELSLDRFVADRLSNLEWVLLY